MKTLIATSLAVLSIVAGASIVGLKNDFVDPEWKAVYGVVSCGPKNAVGFTGLDTDHDGWSVLDEFYAYTSPAVGWTAFPAGGIVPEHPVPLLRLNIQGNVQFDTVPLVVTARHVLHGRIDTRAARWSLSAAGTARSVRIRLADRTGSHEPCRTACYGARPGDVSIRVYAVDGTVITNAVDVPLDMTSGRIGSYCRIRYYTGEVDLDVQRMIRSLAIPMTPTHAEISWTDSCSGLYHGHANMVLHAPDSGYVLPGQTVIECFADIDGDGYHTPGEPYGCAITTVGWFGGSASIGLTTTHPSVCRINIAGVINDERFEVANQQTDRGVRGSYYANFAPVFSGTNVPVHAATRVRVVRSQVNGVATLNGQSYNEVVYDGIFDLTAHPTLTEADLRAKGAFDLDWSLLRSAWMRTHSGSANMTSLTNVAYRVVLGDGTVAENEFNNNLPLVFVNAFQNGAAQTKSVPVAPAGTVYAGQPSFSWRHDALDAQGMKVKDYPAFRLRVWKDAAKSVLVYDSGVQVAPARDAAGVYSWTAPIYADMATPQGQLFSTQENYFWSVSMLDAKFMDPNADETVQEFRMAAASPSQGRGEYASISVSSAYRGSLEGKIIVCACKDPDFVSVPDGMAEAGQGGSQCVIIGLPPGRYYVMAYVDTNGDMVRSPGEPYGFVEGPDGRPVSINVNTVDGQCSIQIYDTANQE